MKIMAKMMSRLPFSMYRPADYYNSIEKIGSKDGDSLSQYSGETENYWPLEDCETNAGLQKSKRILQPKN